MTNVDINEQMVLDIKELLLKYNLFNNTALYYNNKSLCDEKNEIVVKENIKVEEYVDGSNSTTISICYEGDNSLYQLINGYATSTEERKKANKVISELIRIGDKYDRYFELANDNSLYFLSNDDIGMTLTKQQ